MDGDSSREQYFYTSLISTLLYVGSSIIVRLDIRETLNKFCAIHRDSRYIAE
jgi:hypothetical protein